MTTWEETPATVIHQREVTSLHGGTASEFIMMLYAGDATQWAQSQGQQTHGKSRLIGQMKPEEALNVIILRVNQVWSAKMSRVMKVAGAIKHARKKIRKGHVTC